MKQDESKIHKSEVENHAEVISEGRTGEKFEEQDPQESPLAEVRRLNQETKDTLKQIQEQRRDMEETMANEQLGGKAWAGKGKEPTQEEKDTKAADDIVKSFQ